MRPVAIGQLLYWRSQPPKRRAPTSRHGDAVADRFPEYSHHVAVHAFTGYRLRYNSINYIRRTTNELHTHTLSSISLSNVFDTGPGPAIERIRIVSHRTYARVIIFFLANFAVFSELDDRYLRRKKEVVLTR